MKRNNGWYRVHSDGNWEIAHYVEGRGAGWGDWQVCGSDDSYHDRDFELIDDEPVSAVPGSNSDAS